MAGEIILVVEDEPVSLRLLATVLRTDGYRVQLASNAEQALTALRTVRPDLIVSDIRLPGIDGLELTRRVRQDTRTAAVPVVAITAASDREDEHLAFQAGCDGFITKPIDTQTIGATLRSFLPGQTAPPAPLAAPSSPIPEPLALEGPQLEALRRVFLRDAIREVRRMRTFLGGGFDQPLAAMLFHRWIGTAGVLGYMAAAMKAREAEELLAAGATPSQLHRILDELLELLSAPREAAEIAIPEAIVEHLSRRRIALLGFEGGEAERVCAALAQAAAIPYVLAADESAASGAIRGCAAVVIRVGAATRGSPWLAPDFTPPAGVPILLAGNQQDVFALHPRVQANAAEFLLDSWETAEIVMRLSHLLASATDLPAAIPAPHRGRSPAPAHPEILVVDDDANVQAVVRIALETNGMRVHCASSGVEALRTAGESAPDAVVLDVNMGGMDGFEVLAAMRRQSMPARVVMLTARQQERDVLRGFDLGADDYVVKPFSPLELVARLRRLL